jgi:pimeloyl-ACP methyl ester carboxylesterase
MPSDPAPDAEPLVAVHGILRNAEEQARLFARRAASLQRPVIAPLFANDAFPRYQRAVGSARADLALLDLLDVLAAEMGLATRRFALFGFSGGAQFAHRFAWLYPHRVSRLSVAAAGWYTFPDSAPFPYGLAAAKQPNLDVGANLRANLRDFLDLPIDVLVGSADNLVDKQTRSGPEIDAQQGRDRVSRAGRWTNALRAEALALGLDPRIAVHMLPGCGHNFRQCVEIGGLDAIILPTNEAVGRVRTPCPPVGSPMEGERCRAGFR